MKFKKIEFWVATLAMLTFLAVLFYQGTERYEHFLQLNNLQPGLRSFLLSVASPALIGLVIYVGFLLLNLFIFGHLFERKKWDLLIILSLLTLLLMLLGVYATNSLPHIFQINASTIEARRLIPITIFAFSLLLGYVLLKKLVIFYVFQAKTASTLKAQLSREGLLALAIWAAILFLVVATGDYRSRFFLPIWAFMVPCGYILFMVNTYWLIPEHENKKTDFSSYVLKALWVSLLISIPFGINLAEGINFSFLIFYGMEVLIFLPLSWYLYQKNKARIYQLLNLQQALGKTSADLQFLRSQINPHFLFNALNTLYGTALQEKSERTSEGIQKLGDMMRFMLHENLQDRIALEKEIEYLRNYIELQRLRIQQSETILIETDIQEKGCPRFLAPMLLIPFVENAFKHGISLKEKSWVKVNLHCDEETLYFDVYNSRHIKHATDPEKQQAGIGLENVEQRLDLLYPEKHELTIRKTAREFIVHLSLKLDTDNSRGESEVEFGT